MSGWFWIDFVATFNWEWIFVLIKTTDYWSLEDEGGDDGGQSQLAVRLVSHAVSLFSLFSLVFSRSCLGSLTPLSLLSTR